MTQQLIIWRVRAQFELNSLLICIVIFTNSYCLRVFVITHTSAREKDMTEVRPRETLSSFWCMLWSENVCVLIYHQTQDR